MRVGSMFAGIGGFDLGFERAGFEVAWCIEWDKNAQKVLRHRFPNAVIYGDIREVDPAQLAPVDVVCGGFPCQDLSVAGKRKGLAGERSGLFHDAMRLVRHINPSLLVLENVPGLLSSNRGLDFATVLREVGEGWPCAEVAWRILDSRYFGVAQRRRRVFVVASSREGHAEQILALAEGVHWNPAPRNEAREDASGDARGGVGVCRKWWDGGDIAASMTTRCHAQSMPDKANFAAVIDTVPFSPHGHYNYQESDEAATLQDRENRINGSTHLVTVPIQDGRDIDKAQNGLGVGDENDPSYTLDRTGAQAVAIQGTLVGRDVGGPNGLGARTDGTMYTLTKTDIHAVAFRKSKRAQTDSDDETWIDDGVANTLNGFDTGDTRTTHAIAVDSAPKVVAFHPTQDPISSSEQTHAVGCGSKQGCATVAVAAIVAPSLTAANDPSRSPQSAEVTKQVEAVVRASNRMVVRRLTPIECERLQGFPDGWTQIGTAEKPTADSHRYKQLGNAVTVNVAEWIANRIKIVLKGDTMKEELEEVRKLVLEVRELIKDMRFHEGDREPDSEHSICIDLLSMAATKLEFMQKKEGD